MGSWTLGRIRDIYIKLCLVLHVVLQDFVLDLLLSYDWFLVINLNSPLNDSWNLAEARLRVVLPFGALPPYWVQLSFRLEHGQIAHVCLHFRSLRRLHLLAFNLVVGDGMGLRDHSSVWLMRLYRINAFLVPLVLLVFLNNFWTIKVDVHIWRVWGSNFFGVWR